MQRVSGPFLALLSPSLSAAAAAAQIQPSLTADECFAPAINVPPPPFLPFLTYLLCAFIPTLQRREHRTKLERFWNAPILGWKEIKRTASGAFFYIRVSQTHRWAKAKAATFVIMRISQITVCFILNSCLPEKEEGKSPCFCGSARLA